MAIRSTDPTTGEVWADYDELTAQQVHERLDLAVEAYAVLRASDFAERSAVCRRAAADMEERVDELALLATREMGKTLSSARDEVRKCARGLRYYADNAERFLAEEAADASAVGARQALIRWEPLGVVLAVMPWNYPYWQAVRFLAAAYMAGNVGLLKHASNVPACALAIEEVFRRAGAVPGAVQTLLLSSSAVEGLITDPRVAAVTLTGSEGAGRAVGAAAGRALKKVVLELGGSDPFVVLPSADVEQAARVAAKARFQNAGQSCIAAKRFIVHRDVQGFSAAFARATAELVVGDPRDDATDVGPLAVASAAAELTELVDDAAEHGATVVFRGRCPSGVGWYFPPTVVDGVNETMRLYREEAFGPVASVITVDSVDEAISVANATDFGLSASVWTTDAAEQHRLVREIEAGAVFVNGMTVSHPELPFGGIKTSGHGRELSYLGIREFCNAKTMWRA